LYILLRLPLVVVGVALVAGAILSAIRVFVLTRGARDRQARTLLLVLRLVFDFVAGRRETFEGRDRVMALYAPIGLLGLLVSWLTLVLVGFTGIFWAVDEGPPRQALIHSGSALFTLGFADISHLHVAIISFVEAAIGLILIALLIAYLPTMYTAFSSREQYVTMLAVRAGSPPSAAEMIARYHRLGRFDKLNEFWAMWEQWFANLEETHTSLAILAFFRSPQAQHSWVTAAGAVLDSASLINAALDIPHDPQADLTIRAGFLALRTIASYFQLAFNHEPRADDPISIARAEFDEVLDALAAAGVPLKPDREQAWRDFAGWRVNYDGALLALAALTMAPYASWSSDRGLAYRHPYRRWGRRTASLGAPPS